MFINNGKSLFGNTGLIISLLILIILVYFSYNKCYVNNIDSFTTCVDPSSTDPNCIKKQVNENTPQSVRINISGSSVIVNFTIDISNKVPNSFIVVLAQYDINKNNTGNNKFYLSNETILNPNLIPNSTGLSQTNPIQTNLCSIVNGKPSCQYAFTNLDIRDSSGNLYYYKIGVSALYNNNGVSTNSAYVTPYNINNNNKMFTLSSSLDNQNEQNSCLKPSANTYSDTISTADGQYELIKSQLGNYPDNLLLNNQTVTDNSLSDLVDKSMAQALLNVNVSAKSQSNSSNDDTA